MNKVILIGRLTRNPELRYTSSNVACCTFSLAVERNYTNQEGQKEADFINIMVWKNQAENVKKFLTKGSKCSIDGRIQTRNYEDQSGQRKYVTEVVADRVEFLDNKKDGQQSGQEGGQQNIQTTTTQSNVYEEIGQQVKADFSYDESDCPWSI